MRNGKKISIVIPSAVEARPGFPSGGVAQVISRDVSTSLDMTAFLRHLSFFPYNRACIGLAEHDCWY
jgi:hypothetical protein